MHAADSPDLRERLLEIFDAVGLCSLVEPCKNGGRLLRIGLNFGRLGEVSAVRMWRSNSSNTMITVERL
jgi:hypothetical protein